MNKKSWFSLVPLLFVRSIALANGPLPETTEAISPDVAFHQLREGNRRFARGETTHPHQDVARIKDLAAGQSPHTVVLSCSDSRVPPELVFDQGLGDLFVVRSAGHVLSSTAIASIEYAVEHLGARLIVVMGHKSCGAVKAALQTPVGKSSGSTHIDGMIAEIQRNLRSVDRSLASASPSDPGMKKQVRANTDVVADQLFERSALIRAEIEKGRVKIMRGFYNLETGLVEF